MFFENMFLRLSKNMFKTVHISDLQMQTTVVDGEILTFRLVESLMSLTIK